MGDALTQQASIGSGPRIARNWGSGMVSYMTHARKGYGRASGGYVRPAKRSSLVSQRSRPYLLLQSIGNAWSGDPCGCGTSRGNRPSCANGCNITRAYFRNQMQFPGFRSASGTNNHRYSCWRGSDGSATAELCQARRGFEVVG